MGDGVGVVQRGLQHIGRRAQLREYRGEPLQHPGGIPRPDACQSHALFDGLQIDRVRRGGAAQDQLSPRLPDGAALPLRLRSQLHIKFHRAPAAVGHQDDLPRPQHAPQPRRQRAVSRRHRAHQDHVAVPAVLQLCGHRDREAPLHHAGGGDPPGLDGRQPLLAPVIEKDLMPPVGQKCAVRLSGISRSQNRKLHILLPLPLKVCSIRA